MPGPELEEKVIDLVRGMISAPGLAAKLFINADADQISNAAGIIADLRKKDVASQLLALVARIDITPGKMAIRLCVESLSDLVGARSEEMVESMLICNVPFQLRKRGVESKIILADAQTGVDEALSRNIAKAHVWFERIKAGETFSEIAATETTSKRRIQQMIGLAFLAPDIVRDALEGKQPLGFTSDWCLRHEIPSGWSEQRKLIAGL